MNIDQIADEYKDELPGYKLVSYCELGFPIYQLTLHCFMLNDMQIPAIEEFVLNFYDQGVDLIEISEILGLDFDVVEEAWTNLLQRDYINAVTKEITSIGEDYLKEHKVDKLEKCLIPVSIDGLTGNIGNKNSQLMSSKNSKQIGIRTIRSVIDKPNVETIEFNQVKRVLKEYQKQDKESYSGNILEIFHVESKTTKYKRMNVLAYINNDKNVRFLVYDGLNKVEGYENALLQLENRGVPIFKNQFGHYFKSNKINLITDIYQNSKDESIVLGPGKIWELFDEYINNAIKSIFLALPLIDTCSPSEFWIDNLLKVLEKGIDITLVICGREFISVYQKSQYEEIIKIKKKYKNFKCIQTPEYYNKVLIADDNKGIISSYNKFDLGLNASKDGFIEYGYSINQSFIDTIKGYFPTERDFVNIDPDRLNRINNLWITDKMKIISKLVIDFDNYLYSINSIGWLGDGPIPDLQTFLSVPLARNQELFKTFINALNKSLVESMELSGKSKGVKNYFWTEIKNNYTDLHHVLHRIKVYRNYADHLELDEPNKERYYDFLNQDMNGRMPEFIENGFLQLQVKIVNDLEVALRKNLS